MPLRLLRLLAAVVACCLVGAPASREVGTRDPKDDKIKELEGQLEESQAAQAAMKAKLDDAHAAGLGGVDAPLSSNNGVDPPALSQGLAARIKAAEVLPTGPQPTDIPSIVQRFTQMQAVIDTMTAQVGEVKSGILEQEKIANATLGHIDKSDKEIVDVMTLAKGNGANIEVLRTGMGTPGKDGPQSKAKNIGYKLKEVEGVLFKLEGTASELTNQSQEIGETVTKLEDSVKKVLPGVGGVTARVDAADATLKQYSAQLEVEAAGPTIAAKLRATFKRQDQRVKNLTATVIEAQAAKDDDDA